MIPDKKNGYSRETIFGTVVHYDSHGRKTGESVPGFFGEWKNYDEHGKKVSTTRESLFGGNYTYDTKGKKVGWSYDSPLGWTKYYDAKGKKVGESYDTLLGHSRDYGQFANTTSLRPANRRKPDDIPIPPVRRHIPAPEGTSCRGLYFAYLVHLRLPAGCAAHHYDTLSASFHYNAVFRDSVK